jgi:tRNA pseudouridine13 synthase
LYLVRKVGVASTIACWKLARHLGAPRYSIAGLKDANAIAYQYVSLISPRVTPSYVDLGDVRAWYLGPGSVVKPGSHDGNMFRVEVKAGDPELLCRNIRSLDRIPAYYGPQRFGVRRPSSHLYGLALALREPGRLIREYTYRYPLEGDVRLSYEEESLALVSKRRDPWAVMEGAPGIALEALQAYIFNRALSEAIKGGYVERVRETILKIGYCGLTTTIPAVRLPSKELASATTTWARLVRGVAEFEGVRLEMLGELKPSPRPLYFPFKLGSCVTRGDKAIVTLCLPPAAYVTVLLREVAEVDWCSLAFEEEAR